MYEDDGVINVGILDEGKFHSFIDEFSKIDDTEEYALQNNNDIILLSSITDDSFEVIITNKKNKSIDSSTYKVQEFTGHKYKFPYLCFLKGGNEIFRYNFFKNKFTYCKLNSPIVALQSESYEKLSYTGLMDRRDFYMKVFFD